MEEKEKTRQKIWNLLEERDIAKFPGAHGRIPNFKGARKAAQRLRGIKEWEDGKIIFANPDSPQQSVRKLALKDGKKVIMATPKLKSGYLILDPKEIQNYEKAKTISGAFGYGKKVKELPKADLVIQGSVAVDLDGNRLGKGGGYGDREISRLKKEGSIENKTPIATTVHGLQIAKKVPTEPHDQPIDLIITPTELIRV